MVGDHLLTFSIEQVRLTKLKIETVVLVLSYIRKDNFIDSFGLKGLYVRYPSIMYQGVSVLSSGKCGISV